MSCGLQFLVKGNSVPGMSNPVLTVAISAGVDDSLCQRLLHSLEKQSVYKKLQILISPGGPRENLPQRRNALYAQARAPWVYFIDEDCELPDGLFLERLLARLECRCEGLAGGVSVAIGGGYLAEGGLWQKTYNALSTFWLELHARQDQSVPVAGNFAMPRFEGAGPAFPFSLNVPFGGEEIELRKNLLSAGISFALVPELAVVHNSAKTGSGFFRRAWLHGSSPRLPSKRRTALSELWQTWENVRDLRVRALMVAYLATVVTARLTWFLLPKKMS